jgi:D-sedoheptulose 7-phosphate isomerase
VKVSGYTGSYLDEAVEIIRRLDRGQIDAIVQIMVDVRANGGRLFFLGVGGSAGNCSHAVNDFRKIAAMEAYAPTDNVSELTARINDDGWDSVFANWLLGSRLGPKDGIFVFSVGGGDLEKNVSANLVRALELAQRTKAKIVGVVGRDGGFTAQVADACVIVPTINAGTITPHTEAFHSVVWHLIVTHPNLKVNEMKWEATR